MGVKYDIKKSVNSDFPLSREQAIEHLVDKLGKYDVAVGTTGFPSRELYEMRVKKNMSIQQDFYCVGSMGHASSIAMGIALAKPSKKVYCFDGDGAFLMHMGAAAQIGARNVKNFRHILLNNGLKEFLFNFIDLVEDLTARMILLEANPPLALMSAFQKSLKLVGTGMWRV